MKRICLDVANLTLIAMLALAGPSGLRGQQTGDAGKEKQAILDLLQIQTRAWNRGDIDGFMETYWNSPDLTFSSGGQTTRGWQATRDRYKKRYATPQQMGQLKFDHAEVRLLSPEVALVLGNWHLTRKDDTPHGNFSLVLRKLDGNWRIVHDHSSSRDD